MKKVYLFFILLLSLMMASCSDDYRAAIPFGSTAIISIDIKSMNKDSEIEKNFISTLGIKDIEESGIDFSERIYLFETNDGNMGLCCKVSDDDDLAETIKTSGKAKELSKRQGCTFYLLGESWILGYSSSAMLIMGPVIASQQSQMIQKMASYLKMDEDNSILSSPMIGRIDEHREPIAMIAQLVALPEQVAAVFAIGSPKEADASQVIIDASITLENGIMSINGRPMSFNTQINSHIEDNLKVLKPITNAYIGAVSCDNLMSMILNVDGKKFLHVMQQNKSLQMLLAGINQAIDLNAIINSVNGDMVISIPSYSGDKFDISMAARLGDSNWLGDVDYWKTSVPQGGKINDWRHNGYQYTDGKISFFFGVGEDNQFMSGSSPEQALASISKAAKPLDANVIKLVAGKRMAVILSISKILKDKEDSNFTLPLLGIANTIVYTLK